MKPVIESAQTTLSGMTVKPHNGRQASSIEIQKSVADQPAMVCVSAVFHVAVDTISCVLGAFSQSVGLVEFCSCASWRIVDGFAGSFSRVFIAACEQGECHQCGTDELTIDHV